jgi:hypothetical protein
VTQRAAVSLRLSASPVHSCRIESRTRRRLRINQERLQAGRPVPALAKLLKAFVGARDSGLVFANRVGKPLSQTNLAQRSLHPILKELGVHAPTSPLRESFQRGWPDRSIGKHSRHGQNCKKNKSFHFLYCLLRITCSEHGSVLHRLSQQSGEPTEMRNCARAILRMRAGNDGNQLACDAYTAAI